MPIVFVHGVHVRDETPTYAPWWESLAASLRQYVAPVIAADPEKVAITAAYWGDVGARFHWGGISRPTGPLPAPATPPAGQATPPSGITTAAVQGALGTILAARAVSAGIGRRMGLPRLRESLGLAPTVRLRDMTADELGTLAARVIAATVGEDIQPALAAQAAQEVARDPATFTAFAACGDSAAELEVVQTLGWRRYEQLQALTGGPDLVPPPWLAGFSERLDGVLARAARLPGSFAARVRAEIRESLDELTTLFFADVMTYLVYRGTPAAPGPIPAIVLETLAAARQNQQARGGEPLVVLTHSMGGQILYDAITAFLPNIPWLADVRVDFWAATASQVGLFEELKLFLASRPEYSQAAGTQVPFPDRRYLGGWWNVWDANDFISYTVRGIITGVDDEPFDSGLTALRAHDGYLVRPHFFQTFARKLEVARDANWYRLS